jgi:1,4-dihydroxy-2-naphthoyl-CoA hydrolase
VNEPAITGMPEGFTPAVAFDECFDALYGLEVVSQDVAGEGRVRGRVRVRDELLTEHGVMHGGVFAAAAEALASRGTALAVIPTGRMAMGQSNDTNLLAPVSAGAIDIDACVLDRGEDGWVWTVDARDETGRPCAHSRVTVAVRRMPG